MNTSHPLGLPAVGAAALSLLLTAALQAAPPAQSIFPEDTVVWLSLPDAPRFQDKFSTTQIGLLGEDELLAPFAEHLRVQMLERCGNIEASLGVSMDDVLAAVGKEFAIGVAHTQAAKSSGRKQSERAATLITIDPTGKEAEAKTLISKIDSALAKRGAKRSTEQFGDVTLTLYDIPEQEGDKATREQLVQFESGGLLLFVEGRQRAQEMISRIKGAGDSLAKVDAFQETMRRCEKAGGGSPDVRWFLEPFEYDAALRSREKQDRFASKRDTFAILRDQGFDAIRGVGGHIQVAVDDTKDFVHRTAIHAPPKPGTAGQPAMGKYELGMRMAETPNSKALAVQNWAPRGTADYSTFNLDIQNAFDHLESVFDALIGTKDAFSNTLKGFEQDYYGPKIKVREQLIANLGSRITRMSDYQLPITTDCERFLFVIEAKDPAALKGPINKLMENDGAELREVRGVKYWEVVPEEMTPTNASLGGGLIPLDSQPGDEELEDSLLRRAAVAVHGGNLIIASDVEYLEQAIFGVALEESLAGSYDFQAAMRELNGLADLNRCSWSFTRSDEAIRPTYEMLREGKLPEGQTFFARLLNKLLTTSEDKEKGIVRKQRIDASKLPTFELARRYFGPTARAVTAEDNGWFITGVVLNKAGG